MAGKTEQRPGVVIDYKQELRDKFSNINTNEWQANAEVDNYISHFTSEDRLTNLTHVKTVPQVYLPETKKGARSPLSLEAAQNMLDRVSQSLETSIRREIARANSAELYLSDFIEANAVTLSEDQVITGHKTFNSTQTDFAYIDTAEIDEATIGDLHVTNANFDNITTRYLHVTEDTDIDRDATIGRDLEVERDVSINRDLNVDGAAQINGDTTIGNNKFKVSSASGNTNIEGTLDVTKATHLKSTLQTDGNTDLKGTLDVTGATHLKSTAQIDGNTTVTTMQASGKVDLNASNNTAVGLSVTGRLKIPLSRPSNPQPGEIWYEG